ncbi:MAG: nucleotidyltransferase domain-containing protein [Promethearchaeota archaeon]
MPSESRKGEKGLRLKPYLICYGAQGSSMVKQEIFEALRTVYRKLKDEKIRWVLIGTSSLAFQGVDIEVQDIDILTDRTGALRIGELLKEYEGKPVEFGRSEIFESYFGIFRIGGVDVEIMGDLKERIGGRWVSTVQRLESPEIVRIQGVKVAVSSLGEQLRAYEGLGREGDLATIRKIREFLGRCEKERGVGGSRLGG